MIELLSVSVLIVWKRLERLRRNLSGKFPIRESFYIETVLKLTHIRAFIKKFVNCLYKVKIPYSTSMKFWTCLKHNNFKLYNKLWSIRIIFWLIFNVFVSNVMTRRRNLNCKLWSFLNVSHEQESVLVLIIFHLIFILLRSGNLR